MWTYYTTTHTTILHIIVTNNCCAKKLSFRHVYIDRPSRHVRGLVSFRHPFQQRIVAAYIRGSRYLAQALVQTENSPIGNSPRRN